MCCRYFWFSHGVLRCFCVGLMSSGETQRADHLRKMVLGGCGVWAVAWPNTRPSPPSHLVASRLAPSGRPLISAAQRRRAGPRPGLPGLINTRCDPRPGNVSLAIGWNAKFWCRVCLIKATGTGGQSPKYDGACFLVGEQCMAFEVV